MIKIDDLELLGKGRHKHVYQHPSYPDRVIKLMIRTRATESGGRTEQNVLRANRQQGIYREFRRELIQYLQLCKSAYKDNNFMFPVETVHGFERTNQGLGLATEKIISPNRSPLTVEKMVVEGLFDEKARVAFNRFFDDCCDHHVVFGEVNLGGIMYTETRQDRPEFVLVDGIGEKLIIPFRSMSKTINNRNIRKVEEKLKMQLKNLDNSISV